ncbi:hypothetical protein NF27_DT01970 [Candidatus Jidaibacter acanthamoeba]|uniref:Uncharacterized protein n=1 Tax=Candidatus Jidaibacter acanthamoebae TaxID=86105 RepID=A0A0C1QMZ9_9RICK|nr:ankyrin repeat domain-containing protein [Candidatus Jidaibacter acanthamoeba]KIE05423.1 hypothetical protein NF27_DT01970 [Candidatus Jidaibacter acanthamoeba]
MAQGADVNAKDNLGFCALFYAVHSCYRDIAMLLLNQEGININITDRSNITPLHIAAANGYLEMVELLLNNSDIDVDATDIGNETALYKAINNYHIKGMDKIVDLLLVRRANLNIQTDKKGETALHAAAVIGDLKLCKKLLEHGANPNLKIKEYMIKYDERDADGIKMAPRTAYEIYLEEHPSKAAKFKAVEEKLLEKEHKKQRGEKRKAVHLKSQEQEGSTFNNEQGSKNTKQEFDRSFTKRHQKHIDDTKNAKNNPKGDWRSYILVTNNQYTNNTKQIS